MKDQSIVKPYYLIGPSHPHLIHFPLDAAHNCFTYTMKDNMSFYFHHKGQDIKLIQYRSSEYMHITRNLKE